MFGIGESLAESLLKDLMTSSTNPTLAPYAKEGEVNLRITASAATAEEGYAMMEPLMEDVYKRQGSLHIIKYNLSHTEN